MNHNILNEFEQMIREDSKVKMEVWNDPWLYSFWQGLRTCDNPDTLTEERYIIILLLTMRREKEIKK